MAVFTLRKMTLHFKEGTIYVLQHIASHFWLEANKTQFFMTSDTFEIVFW